MGDDDGPASPTAPDHDSVVDTGPTYRVRRRSRSTSTEDERADRLDVSDDDRDVGWGDGSGLTAASGRSAASRRDEWYLRERPPHHEG